MVKVIYYRKEDFIHDLAIDCSNETVVRFQALANQAGMEIDYSIKVGAIIEEGETLLLLLLFIGRCSIYDERKKEELESTTLESLGQLKKALAPFRLRFRGGYYE